MAAWVAQERGIKRSILVWHRRAGKDEVALHEAAVAAHLRPATYWHMLPEYTQARKAIWNAVNPHSGIRRIDEAFPMELRENTNDQEMFIRFKSGSTWQVVGSDRYDAHVGTPPAGIVFSEWALSNPAAWAYLAPILLENGGWARFISTPRGRNHLKKMLDMAEGNPAWFSQVLTVTDTGAVSPEAVEEQRKEYHAMFGVDQGDALIEQEYFCSFEAAILGAYWGREMAIADKENRLCDVGYDDKLPVHTAWDLGVGDSTAIWFFQVHLGEVRVIDFYEAQGYSVEHYVEVLRDRGYAYGNDYVPHDAKVREWTNAGPGGVAKTRIETMLQFKRKPVLVPDHKLDDGINAARRTLGRCIFNAKKCEQGIEALRQYRREWDEADRVFRDRPLRDWTSHASDAFRYLSMAWHQIAGEKPVPPIKTLQTATLDDLWKANKRRENRI